MRGTRTAITLLALAVSTCCPCRQPVQAPTDVAPVEPAAAEPACEGAPICWFHDDYPAALAHARQRELPLVVDMWAPWCHTCLSMKHDVLAGPGIAPLAERFVWLALDTDAEENAPALERLPVSSWPTFYVVSPVDESVQARYVGAASIDQFREFLAVGEAGHLDALAAGGELAADDPRHLLRRAERAAAAGDLARADELYGEALDAAPADWPRRADVLTSRIAARARQQRWVACAELGLVEMGATGSSASAGDFCYWAVSCAGELESGDLLREQVHMRALERLSALADDEGAPLSADDRSDVLRLLREVQHETGDREGARSTAERQLAWLDEAAAAASGPVSASTFNWPRAEVYVYLKRGAEIIPALERSAADLPEDYDPPYRVAWVALQIGDLDRALPAAERALALAYGPRKGRVLTLIADIHAARGDSAAERDHREQALAHYESLPPGQRDERAIEAARAALEKMDEPQAEPALAQPEATPPPMSERERKREISRLSRKYKNPPKRLTGDDLIIYHGEVLGELEALGAFAVGMKKADVRRILGKPDWIDDKEPRYYDTRAEVEWHYEISMVGGYCFGFVKDAVVYHLEYAEDANPP